MSYSELRISVETLYKRKVFTFIGGHHMKIREPLHKRWVICYN